MKTTQKQIAEMAKISAPYLSQIIKRDRVPSWRVSKQLADITATDPILWLEGTTEQIKAALEEGTQPQPQ